MVGNKINLEVRVYRSQCKWKKPYITVITITDDNIQDKHCSCTAGYDEINLNLTSLLWRGTEMLTFVYVFLTRGISSEEAREAVSHLLKIG